MVGEPEQYWLLYLRWASGRRETICTANPEEIIAADARFVVLACMPMPRIQILGGMAFNARRERLQAA